MSRLHAWSLRPDPGPLEPDDSDSRPSPALDGWAFRNSRAMRAVEQMIDRVAPTDATVLILGESGVGKALVARALHDRSLRYTGPFVKVNCAALPLELLESELFGYERGAFTGADRQHPGRFELANMGTIFLDEIGEMPLPLQAKLLHVLQDREFSRLGGRHDIRVDVRVVAATNKNLAGLVEQGLFRDDLYYRLNVMSISVPPLRARPEEIPVLIEHFLSVHARQYGRPRRGVSVAALERMQHHAWPGNVRELENLVRRIVLLESEDRAMDGFGTDRVAPGATPAPEGAPDSPRAGELEVAPGPAIGLKEIGRRAAAAAESTTLRAVLEHVGWHRLEAARTLGVSYKTLLTKLRQHGLGIAACCWLALR